MRCSPGVPSSPGPCHDRTRRKRPKLSPNRSQGVVRIDPGWSALGWMCYPAGYEVMFRGYLLFPLAAMLGVWPAVGISTILPRSAFPEHGALTCLPAGVDLLITLQTESVFLAWAGHAVVALFNTTYQVLVALRFNGRVGARLNRGRGRYGVDVNRSTNVTMRANSSSSNSRVSMAMRPSNPPPHCGSRLTSGQQRCKRLSHRCRDTWGKKPAICVANAATLSFGSSKSTPNNVVRSRGLPHFSFEMRHFFPHTLHHDAVNCRM